MQQLKSLPLSHLFKINHHQIINQTIIINCNKNLRSFSTTCIHTAKKNNEQSNNSSSSNDNLMKRLNPNRQFKQFWTNSLFGKYDSVTSAAFNSLKLFADNPKELSLDNQLELKYLPIIIHRNCDGKVIRQPGLYKTVFSMYPPYDCFGYGVSSELSKKLYCSNEKTRNEVWGRRSQYSKAIEYMENANEDFSNILLSLKMIPISEWDVWQFNNDKTEHDILIIKYCDTESLIESFVHLAEYCNQSAIQFEIPFYRFPIQISYTSDFQKSVIQSAIAQIMQRNQDDEKFTKVEYDLTKQFLGKSDILTSEKIGNVYFPKLRNNLLTISDFFLLFIF